MTRVVIPVDEQRVRELIAEVAKPVATQGCICPPTAERTCQGMMCPRKPVRFT